MRAIGLLVILVCCGCAAPGSVTSFDGVDIHFDDRGSGDPALVFVHGWMCDRTHWSHTIDDLSDRYRVVAVDLAGHGESGLGRTELVIPAFARDIVSVVKFLDLNEVILVGHSMGGPVCLEAAARLPERVTGVIAVDSLHDAEMKVTAPLVERMTQGLDADPRGFWTAMIEGAVIRPDDPDLAAKLIEATISKPQHVATAVVRGYLEFDLMSSFEKCPVPIRCINTQRPTRIENNRKYALDFDEVRMEEMGHFPMLERPSEFNALLREQVEALTARIGLHRPPERD